MTNTELINASKIMIGSQEAEAIYVGSNLIWNSVPYDAEIEYLESTGTQCIDTGITPTTSCEFDVDISVSNDTTTDSCIFSAATQWAFGLLGLFIAEQKFYYLLGNDKYLSFSNDRHVFSVNSGSLYFDNTIKFNIQLQQQNIQTTLKLLSHGDKTKALKGKLYGFTYYDQNVNMDLIPVRVGQVGYMYDKVNGQLFGNSGTGDFVLGPDKTN